MSRAISRSPLLGPLLVYEFTAPRTLSSIFGGSGMPTCVQATQIRAHCGSREILAELCTS